MALQANINLVVPPLDDNTVWWANAAAWSNYWKDINLNVNFNGADTLAYNQLPYDGTINFVRLNVDGNNQDVPSLQQHVSLVAAFNALQAEYVAFKTALKNAGYITTV